MDSSCSRWSWFDTRRRGGSRAHYKGPWIHRAAAVLKRDLERVGSRNPNRRVRSDLSFDIEPVHGSGGDAQVIYVMRFVGATAAPPAETEPGPEIGRAHV